MVRMDPSLKAGMEKTKHVNLAFTDAEYRALKGIAIRHDTSPQGICYAALSEWIMRNDAARRASNADSTV